MIAILAHYSDGYTSLHLTFDDDKMEMAKKALEVTLTYSRSPTYSIIENWISVSNIQSVPHNRVYPV